MALQIISNKTPAEDGSVGRFLVKNTQKKIYDPENLTITDIKQAVKNPNRVNIFVNEAYAFSLDIFQLARVKIKVGNGITKEELAAMKDESAFGKLYMRALEYCLMRPHSHKEVKDYLYRKSQPRRKQNGEMTERLPQELSRRVTERLIEKGYIDDRKFAHWWIENRHQRKGVSRRKMSSELSQKGVSTGIVEELLSQTSRNDDEELQKILAKKRTKYPDEKKLVAYLARQGFSYEDIKAGLRKDED